MSPPPLEPTDYIYFLLEFLRTADSGIIHVSVPILNSFPTLDEGAEEKTFGIGHRYPVILFLGLVIKQTLPLILITNF
jgi:hypothetical protein